MAPPGAILAATLELLGRQHPRRGEHRRARRDRRALHPLPGRDAYVQGLPRLPRLDLRLAQRDGRARHPRRLPARGGRHHLDRRRRHARRLGRRRRAHLPRGAGRPEAEQPAERHRGVAARRRRAVPRGQPHGRRLARDPARRRGRRASSVVRSLVGHGVGRRMHEDPQVPNYGKPGKGPLLEEGMVLAIEPMTTAGRPAVRVGGDGWAIFSQDGSPAAHFEFTVAVTAEGPRVLTPWHSQPSSARRAAHRGARSARAASATRRAPSAQARSRAPGGIGGRSCYHPESCPVRGFAPAPGYIHDPVAAAATAARAASPEHQRRKGS